MCSKSIVIAIAAVGVLLTTPAQAETEIKDLSCDFYNRHNALSNSNDIGLMLEMVGAIMDWSTPYLLGYANALGEPNFPKTLYLGYLNQYCKENPDATIYNGLHTHAKEVLIK